MVRLGGLRPGGLGFQSGYPFHNNPGFIFGEILSESFHHRAPKPPSQTIRWNFCQISRLHLTRQDSSVFLCNFLAIIPLAWIIGKSTEDLSSAVGQTLGGLLNASFGRLGRDHWNWIKLHPREIWRMDTKNDALEHLSTDQVYIYIYHIYICIYYRKGSSCVVAWEFYHHPKGTRIFKDGGNNFQGCSFVPETHFRELVATAGVSRDLNIDETRVWRLWFRAKSTTLVFSRFLWFWGFATLKSVVSMGWWFPNLYIKNGCLKKYPIGDELLPTWGLYIS